MPQESEGFFDRSFQEALVAHFIRCSRFHRLVLSGTVTQEDFDYLHLRVAFQALLGVLKVQGIGPAVDSEPLAQQARIVLATTEVVPGDQVALLDFLVGTFSRPVSEDYYYNSLENFLGTQRIHKKLRTARGNQWREIGSTFSDVAFGAKITMGEPVKPFEDFSMTPESVSIPTNLACINRKLPGGGLGLKKYGILCAYTGVGKTTLGLNFAWGGAMVRHKVCFASLELTANEIKERLYSLVGHINYNSLRYGEPPTKSRQQVWEEARQKVLSQTQESMDCFQIWDFSEEICTVPLLEDWIRREIDRDPNNPPRVLFVDWLMCLDEDVKKTKIDQISGKEMRHKLQRYGHELSRMSVKYNMAIWAMHQANEKAEDNDVVTMKHSAEGRSAAWKCAVFLGVGISDAARKLDPPIFTVTASKMRDGRTFTAKIRGRLEQQRFESIDEEGEDPTLQQVEASNIQSLIAANRSAPVQEAPPPLPPADVPPPLPPMEVAPPLPPLEVAPPLPPMETAPPLPPV